MASSGRFKLNQNDKEYYTDMFKEVININTVNMKTNIANVKTLLQTADNVFSKNLQYLSNIDSACISYQQLYNKILYQTKNK